MTYALKVDTNRQYAYNPNLHDEFWEGAGRFLRGMPPAASHSPAFMAHRYPHKFWLRWGLRVSDRRQSRPRRGKRSILLRTSWSELLSDM
jgi:hypothetical protein